MPVLPAPRVLGVGLSIALDIASPVYRQSKQEHLLVFCNKYN